MNKREEYMAVNPYCFLETPIGMLLIKEDSAGITEISFADEQERCDDCSGSVYLTEAKKQLEEYFEGKRSRFDIPLSLHGTEFQQKVWKKLQTIPYGETRSYQEIAAEIGNPKASRAVGMANNRNPIVIVIPCHRVIGKNSKLTGYAAGIDKKQYLMDLERKV